MVKTELGMVTEICSANLSEHIKSCSAITKFDLTFKQLIICTYHVRNSNVYV